jgi:hypothetical protein
VAYLLLRVFDEEVRAVPPGAYSPFDTKVGYWLEREASRAMSLTAIRANMAGLPILSMPEPVWDVRIRQMFSSGQTRLLPTYAEISCQILASACRARIWVCFG